MSARLNHARSITYGDQLKNIPISSSPDSYDRICDIELGIKIFRSLKISILTTRNVTCTGKRGKIIGRQLTKVVMPHIYQLPRALTLSSKALEDQRALIKDSFEKEPMTGFKKPDSLEKQEPRLDN